MGLMKTIFTKKCEGIKAPKQEVKKIDVQEIMSFLFEQKNEKKN